jgi:brefeldin A-resistance guanine nucleotide exchange factor 1
MAGFIELKRAVKDMEGDVAIFSNPFLRSHILTVIDIRKADLTDLLAPFFAILRSPLSTGPITSSALSALHSFFACGLFLPDSPSIDAVLNELSSTISHCKFEASDSSGDEVVLLRIMTVIQDCLCGSVGRGLGDIEVCEMLETVLTTCCQMRLSGELSCF